MVVLLLALCLAGLGAAWWCKGKCLEKRAGEESGVAYVTVEED